MEVNVYGADRNRVAPPMLDHRYILSSPYCSRAGRLSKGPRVLVIGDGPSSEILDYCLLSEGAFNSTVHTTETIYKSITYIIYEKKITL